jgi:hypothetical protein
VAAGVVTGVAALGASAVIATKAINRLADSSIEAGRKFQGLAAPVAGAIARADFDRELRALRFARARGEAAGARVDAGNRLEEAIFNTTFAVRVGWENFKDSLFTKLGNKISSLLESINESLGIEATTAQGDTLKEIFAGGTFLDVQFPQVEGFEGEARFGGGEFQAQRGRASLPEWRQQSNDAVLTRDIP